ncbi:MAG TPA: flagellar type III secretion system pore protein FliP [Pseudobacteroides sp.]|uniref:flagellar type III secretion system pore protein FliP n=1 Tax=Pseudobacteroides sp. TaxID=1968840 RepID=UPI002F94907A
MRNKKVFITIIAFIFIMIIPVAVFAEQSIPIPKIGLDIGTSQNPKDVSSSIQILLLLTVLSLAPSILMMMTSFTRIIIILSFLRNALGTQQMPPNQVLIGLALFLTLFIMAPVGKEINEQAFQPYTKGEITQQVAVDKASTIIKNFMYKYIYEKDLALFVSLSGGTTPVKKADLSNLSLTVVIPAFLISELKTAFQIGFLIYLPFLVIDMVVSSTLMSMGMMMLPPVMISLPFKILLFIMVDGWNLLTKTIVNSFVR